ncbi:MAG: hypothetical protein M3Z50_04405 [Actinomycetota bacterium]|nr:hypothetical protein [Actinomycetota bacterium]
MLLGQDLAGTVNRTHIGMFGRSASRTTYGDETVVDGADRLMSRMVGYARCSTDQ